MYMELNVAIEFKSLIYFFVSFAWVALIEWNAAVEMEMVFRRREVTGREQ